METFNIIPPSPLLANFIKHYWLLETDGNSVVTERTIPIGCMHLIFHRGSQLFSSFENELQPRSFICGQTTFYTDVTSTGKINMIVVVFQPYGAKAFFPMSMHEFHGKNISVTDIGDQSLVDLEKRLLDTTDNNECIRIIERYLLNRLHSFTEYNLRRITAVIQGINKEPLATIPDLSQIACLSDKQLNRIFTEYIGSTPKEFTRIVRLQRALYSLQNYSKMNFAQLAYECGFYDQAHLIKEFKTFSGYTPKEYLAICNPYSDYFSVS